MARTVGLAGIVLLGIIQSFAQSTPKIPQGGNCSVNIAGNNNTNQVITCVGMSAKEAQQISKLLNKIAASQLDRDLVMSRLNEMLDAIKHPSPCTPGKPRIDAGPDGYKGVCDEDLAEWVMDESQKIEDLSRACMNGLENASKTGYTLDEVRWDFTRQFSECCEQELKQLHAELMKRFGPIAKMIPDEQRYWESLYPEELEERENVPPQFRSPINSAYRGCGAVLEYAPYLRLLGQKLRRRVVPRKPPKPLEFHMAEAAPPKDGRSKFGIITAIETKVPITAGFIVVEIDGRYLSGKGEPADVTFFTVGYDRPIDNEPLVNYLSPLDHFKALTMRIGKTPITPGQPFHLDLWGPEELNVTKVTWFDE